MHFHKNYIILFFVYHIDLNFSVKVCSTWIDYWKLTSNNSCRQNLDAESEFTEIIRRWGKNVETYEVLTYDGYFITLFRIPAKSADSNPVLLLHSVFMNSLALVNRGNNSVAYKIVEAAYDVWLINFRGTKYSRNHIALSATDAEYWNFGFHEWGVYDIKAALDKISMKNPKKVLLIGLGNGSTAAFIYATEHTQEAAGKLSGMVSLSPTTAPLNAGFVLKAFVKLSPYVLKPIVEYFYHGEIPPIFHTIRASSLCSKLGIWIARLCDIQFQMLTGIDISQQDPETLPVIIAQNKDSEPLKNFIHLNQMLNHKKFTKFDYGMKKNMELYGQSFPPVYEIRKLNVPQVFFVAENDEFGTIRDAIATYQQIEEVYQKGIHKIEYKKFSHEDFFQAKDINVLVYQPLMKAVIELIPPIQS